LICSPLGGSFLAAETSGESTEAAEAPRDGEGSTASTDTVSSDGAEASDDEAGDLEPETRLGKVFSVKKDNPEGFVDKFRMDLKSRLDRSADWADGLLGTDDYQGRPEDTNGRVSANVYWQEREGIKVRGRFRVRVNLDNLNNRFNAMIGKGDPQDLMSVRYENSSRFASFYQGDDSDEFLAGIGYTPDWASKNNRFSLGGGVHLTWPPSPYIKLNYDSRFVSEDERMMVNFYQTFYYRTDEGFGSTTTIAPEILISDNYLLKWHSTFDFGEEPEGLILESFLTLYQDLGRDRALAYEAGVYVETGRVVQFINYGASITYRQKVFRDWMFGEVTLGLAWPREYPEWNRSGDFLIGFGLEFFFGDGR